MKISPKTISSMRIAAGAMLVAGSVTGTASGVDETPVSGAPLVLSPVAGRAISPVMAEKAAKEPEKKEEKKEQDKDPCPPCGRG